jgi:hypothetical protein
LNHRILHANSLVIRRSTLLDIGGYWEQISFAEDHDFAMRLIDKSSRTLFRSEVVAELDVTPHDSAFRRLNEEEQRMFSIVATLHAEYRVSNPVLRTTAKRNRAWRLLELGNMKMVSGERDQARNFAVQSLLTYPSKTAALLLLQSFTRSRATHKVSKLREGEGTT